MNADRFQQSRGGTGGRLFVVGKKNKRGEKMYDSDFRSKQDTCTSANQPVCSHWIRTGVIP